MSKGEKMSIQIKYSHEGAGVMFIGEGVISAEDIFQATKLLYQSDSAIKKIRFCLNDFTKATSTTITSEELSLSIQEDEAAEQINPKMVVAVVADSDFLFGMSRMWHALAGDINWEMYITRSLAEAKDWITYKTGLELN